MTALPTLRLADRQLGAGHPVFIVAELSANHNGSYQRAADIVRAAAASGADAVKLQTYTADTMTLDLDTPPFRIDHGTQWDGTTLHDLYRRAHTPWEWHPRLQELAKKLGLVFFSSPFDASAVDFLEGLDVPAHKIASFEIVDIPLLEKVAATGKPVILSTGMSSDREIEEALATLTRGGSPVALLRCTSAYPAPPEEMHLRRIRHLAERHGVPVGLSDHTLGIEVAVAAVALGACIIEKHVTLARDDGGPDSSFSLEPQELADLVAAVRKVEAALGNAQPATPGPAERGNRRFRRSLFVTADVARGDTFTSENVRCIRPGHGLHPRHYQQVLGRTAARDVALGTPLSWELVAEPETP